MRAQWTKGAAGLVLVVAVSVVAAWGGRHLGGERPGPWPSRAPSKRPRWTSASRSPDASWSASS